MIEIKGLTKKYGSFYALNDLNLTLSEGTVFGFVGANGAGKSTTFSILAHYFNLLLEMLLSMEKV